MPAHIDMAWHAACSMLASAPHDPVPRHVNPCFEPLAANKEACLLDHTCIGNSVWITHADIELEILD